MADIKQALENNHLGTILLAVVILVVTAAVAHCATWLIRSVLAREMGGRPVPRDNIAENVARGFIWVIGASLILAYCFGVDVDGMIAALGVGGIALSLGFQDTLSNIIGGVQVTWLGIIEVGDHVIIGDTEGIVENVNWRQTTVRDFERIVHVIPNSVINSSEVNKFEPANLVTTSICFTNDKQNVDGKLAEAERIAKEAVSEVAELERDPWILTTGVGEYGTYAKLRFMLKDMSHVREARDAAVRAITPLLRAESEG